MCVSAKKDFFRSAFVMAEKRKVIADISLIVRKDAKLERKSHLRTTASGVTTKLSPKFLFFVDTR